MDINSLNAKFKKVAGGASTVFNRAVQFTEEKLGTAEKTELDAHFENLMQRSDKTKLWSEHLLKNTDAVLNPNPNHRMEDMLYEKLDKKKKERVTQFEVLGNVMVEAGNDFGPGTAYGNALVKCGQAQIQIGNAERDFITATSNNFLQPLSNFLEGDMKTILKEKKILETKRLDLDACKSRLRKAKSATTTQQRLEINTSPVGNRPAAATNHPYAMAEDDVAKAEVDLRVAQSEFDRQSEITKILLEGINSTHAHHLRCLNDFIEAQMTFFAQSQQYVADLQRQLGSFSSLSAGLGNNNGSGTSLSGSPVVPSAPPSIEVTAPSPTEKRQAKALYDYDAADSSELSLLADELIMVYKVKDLDPDWLMAERGSQRGKVPVTYLKVLE